MILIIQACAILKMIISEIRPTSASFTGSKSAESHIQKDKNTNDQTKFSHKLEVPELDPFAIAPNLAKPPKAAGDFGKKSEQ